MIGINVANVFTIALVSIGTLAAVSFALKYMGVDKPSWL